MSISNEYKFISHCENLANGELHIFKDNNKYYCFDVNRPHNIYELLDDSGEPDEYNTEIHSDIYKGYSVCIFFYPNNNSKNFMQLFYKTNTEIHCISEDTNFTIAKVK
jgi:hypothetical protein